jgi:hypothetical protein
MTGEDEDSDSYLLFVIAVLVAALIGGWFMFV